MVGIRRQDIIDIDEAGVFVEQCNRGHGKAALCCRVREDGPYGHSEKLNILMAISGEAGVAAAQSRRWVETWNVGGTTTGKFIAFILRILHDIGPGTNARRYCFTMDNLNSHRFVQRHLRKKNDVAVTTNANDENKKKMTKKKPKKKRVQHKKPPNAPKRFQSSFIFFSKSKHKEIKEQKEQDKKDGKEHGSKTNTPNVAKVIGQAWKDLSAEERKVFDEMARKDKARYEVEKEMYDGPWKVTALELKKMKKDPNAPKRPMSAYLSYANSKRTEVKLANSALNNKEISRLLSQMWKDAPEEEKKVYVDEEFTLRQAYLSSMAEYKKNKTLQEEAQRKERENFASAIASQCELAVSSSDSSSRSSNKFASTLSSFYTGSTSGTQVDTNNQFVKEDITSEQQKSFALIPAQQGGCTMMQQQWQNDAAAVVNNRQVENSCMEAATILSSYPATGENNHYFGTNTTQQQECSATTNSSVVGGLQSNNNSFFGMYEPTPFSPHQQKPQQQQQHYYEHGIQTIQQQQHQDGHTSLSTSTFPSAQGATHHNNNFFQNNNYGATTQPAALYHQNCTQTPN